MKIVYFAGGNRLKTLEKIFLSNEFTITQIYISENEFYFGKYKKFADENGIEMVKVNKLNLKDKFIYKNEDILLSVGFRYIIDKSLFGLFKYAINIHPSLLPKYRGAYSGYAVLENGEKETGITAHLLDDGIDTGDIINQLKIPIKISDTIDSITEKLLDKEPSFVINTLLMIKNNNFTLKKQPKINNEIVYNRKRKPEDSRIDPTKSLLELLPKIKSCSKDFPAYFEINGVKVKIRLEFENEI